MSIFKLAPACKNYIWGGQKLKTRYGKQSPDDIVAETWELSCHPAGMSVVACGEYAGLTLPELIRIRGRAILGENCRRFQDFPILVKFIDAAGSLSVQVHPDNAYARTHEGQNGKTEMWVVMDCEPGSFLYFGFSRDVTREELARRIRENRLTEILNRVEVKKGDVFFIAPGTIHAIGAGILIAEIQQSSDVTYRVYDFGRLGKDGKPRELHIEKALDVLKLAAEGPQADFGGHLGKCDYFVVDGLSVAGAKSDYADGSSFHALLFYEGAGEMRQGAETLPFRMGDCFFVEAGSGPYEVRGEGRYLKIRIPARK